MLVAVKRMIGRFVVLPGEAEAVALAVYVLHTWAFDAAWATPYLVTMSAEKESGKTRLLEVLRLLVRAPWQTASASRPAIFRKIETDKPTLLLDEVDAVFGSNTERTEPIRAVLNAGNRRGSSATRCVGQGAKKRGRGLLRVLPEGARRYRRGQAARDDHRARDHVAHEAPSLR